MPPPVSDDDADDLDLHVDPNAARNRQTQRRRERRRRKRERRATVRRGDAAPTKTEFLHAVRSQNWHRELKPPPAVSDREEPRVNKVLVGTLNRDCPESETAAKKRKAEEKRLQQRITLDPIPENRRRGQPIYLQFQRNEVIPSFALQDSSARAVSHRWVTLNPSMNLQEEMCRIILQVDDSEQAFVAQYNRSLLVHSARWRLWKKHGDAQDIQQVDPREAPVHPNKPRCREPFYKSTQMIAFGERLREAI
ncbi:MAG: hypothetical protein M1837_003215 [Sclerophora amabilis]|nr:MAG: hypothetical protein M1837_003215 [Sclerophora amabilis]